jgi:hypothetical protein
MFFQAGNRYDAVIALKAFCDAHVDCTQFFIFLARSNFQNFFIVN